ncbi:lytic transglycosylase domain-containing protein [Thermocrinis sp.]
MRIEWGSLWLKTTRPGHIQIENKSFEGILNNFLDRENSTKVNSTDIDALIERTSLKYGIPKEIISAIIQVESGFNPNAYNKNKDGTEDRGLMQVNYQHNLALMKEYGITDPDQLYDPAINVELGARILYENYKRFGNWVMAIKAYNGLNADNWDYVRRVLRNIQQFRSFSEK